MICPVKSGIGKKGIGKNPTGDASIDNILSACRDFAKTTVVNLGFRDRSPREDDKCRGCRDTVAAEEHAILDAKSPKGGATSRYALDSACHRSIELGVEIAFLDFGPISTINQNCASLNRAVVERWID